uniref:UBC core domain-containing protein n=1 Tax=Arion vulgaris TaxID=1028688 RepID=A0A0B7AQH6_9EUPU
MAACSLFEEDEVYVYKPGKGYSFGLVLENSEFLSSGEEDEVDAVNDRLHKGTIRVSWHPTGKETVVAEDKVQLLDRSLMPGDVVRRLIPGQESQCGFVMDMDVRCHLRILCSNKYIYNVNSKDLTPLQKFEYGQEVMLDSWLGRIEGFDLQVILLFSDGARCQTDENEICTFRDVLEKGSRGEFSICPFYPGQELKGKLDCLSEAKWLHSTSRFCHKTANKKGKSSTIYVKVEKVMYKSVEIHWLSRGFEKGDNVNEAFSPPPGLIEADNAERLKVLDWFSHCSVQIGDHTSYRIKNDDNISSIEPAKAYDPKTAVIKDAIVKMSRDSDNKKHDEPVASSGISGTSIEKDQDDGDDADFEDIDDGDKSDPNEKNCASGGCRGAGGGRGSKKKNKVVKTLGQRHKPGKPAQNQKPGSKKQGPKEHPLKPDEVVQVEIEFTTSWATVMWQDGTVERDIPSVELFPVHHLDDLEFFPGDFVLSTVELNEPADYGVIVKADHGERTCLIHWMKAYEVGKANSPTVVASNCEVSVYDITDHPDYKFRPGQSIVRVGGFEHLSADPGGTLQAVGQIFELDPNGHLVVKWANGTISQCYPQEVYILSEDIDDGSDNNSLESWASESDYETDGSGETWETESENEIIGEDSDERGGRDDSGFDQGALCEHKQELDALLSRAETALVRLEKLLNVFDISTVSVPECFHDIIRIYRSCHDLDKILQSSFFIDPELQSLVSQAKKELRRDKASKISKHLSQLFEAWSNSLPAEDGENVGTVAFGGKTIRVGAQRKGVDIEVSLQVSTEERDSCDISLPLVNTGAAGGSEGSEGNDNSALIQDSSAISDLSIEHADDEPCEPKGTKEPAINDCSRSGKSDRRSSDPSNISAALGTKSKKKNKDANLVGENCVSKASKRTKSDSCDDFGHEAKKSKDETMAANRVAQELCYKICQNLQKQILKIHEEVNKRTRRLMNVAVKHNNVANEHVTEDVNVPAMPNNYLIDNVGCDQNEDSEDVSASVGQDEDGQCRSPVSKPNLQTRDSSPAINQCEKKPTDDNGKSDPETNGEKNLVPDDADDNSCEVLPSNSSLSHKEEATASLEDVKTMQVPCKGFDMYGEVQSFHMFVSRESQPANPRAFRTAVRKELKLFQTSLPDGIFIKGFEDRLDLYSFMIIGPAGTPYEDAVFLFDMMLPNEYPYAPPLCHYHSYCSDRLNPNLYEDGKVCVSLLGTWAGKGTEVWTSKSNLLQVLVSIQGLILVPEPYYNEAGYERQRGTQVGQENSRMYNEMATLKTVQSLIKMCHSLPTLFKEDIYQYLKAHGPRMISRLRYWMQLNEQQKKQTSDDGYKSSATQMKTTLTQPNISNVTQPDSVGIDTRSQTIYSAQSNDKTFNGTLNSHADSLPTSDADAALNYEQSPNQLQNPVGESNDQNIPDAGLDQQNTEASKVVIAEHIASDLELPKVDHMNTLAHVNGDVSNLEMAENDEISEIIVSGLSVPHHNESSSVDSHLTTDLHGEILPNVMNSKENITQANRDKDVLNNASGQESHIYNQPEFPLFPMSRGFCLTLQKFLNVYENALQKMEPPTSS